MDDEVQKFFKELAQKENGQTEEISLEPDIELTKSSALPTKSKFSSKKESFSELMDEGEGQLTIDVYQTPEEIVVESTIAGVDPENLDIDITPEAVTIRGKREKEKKVAEENYFYQECYWGKFSRSVILPQEINPEESTATLKNGVLTVRMPKLKIQKTKKVKVRLE